MGPGDVAEKAAPPATAGTAHGTSRVWGLGIDDGPLASRRWAQRGGRQRDDAGFPQGLGSLLRHVFASCLIPGLAGRVVDSTLPGPLIPPSGGVKGGPAGASRPGPGAVPIPAECRQRKNTCRQSARAQITKRSESSTPRGCSARGWTRAKEMCELWSRGQAESRWRALWPRGSGGVAPSGPHPLGAPSRTVYPTSAGRGNRLRPPTVRCSDPALSEDQQHYTGAMRGVTVTVRRQRPLARFATRLIRGLRTARLPSRGRP